MNEDNNSNSKSLVPFKLSVKDLNVQVPSVPENSAKGTCTGISNAWVKFSRIDEMGMMWVDIERLASILRTKVDKARYYLGRIDDDSKRHEGKKTYVRAYEIGKLIDQFIQEERMGKRKEYLRYSEKVYKAIRDCDAAENTRTKYRLELEDERRKLKRKRIRKYKIEYDELTGEPLKKRSAEFSHIRSAAIYSNVAAEIENGLIVNKTTHTIITSENINDEIQLRDLCRRMGWSIEWYDKYRKYFELEEDKYFKD